MANLIYQFWDGPMRESCQAGVDNMKAYAESIGAEYLFEHNPEFIKSQGINLGTYTPHYGAFKPVYDTAFDKYDNVMFADTDVFAVDGIDENIFDYFETLNADVAMCTEPLQPKLRQISTGIAKEEFEHRWADSIRSKWNTELPKTEEGLYKVFNSGVVLYSRNGLNECKNKFPPFLDYIKMVRNSRVSAFYEGDQNYLHCMIFVCKLKFAELNNEWNRYITLASKQPRTICDPRTPDTKLVHIQMRGADHLSAAQLWKVTNLPVSEWGVDPSGNAFIRGDCMTGEIV